MKYPLAWGAFIFSSGIFLADKIRLSHSWPALSAAAFLLLSILTLKNKRLCILFLSLSLFSLGGFALRNAYNLPRNHIARFIPYAAGGVYAVKGYVNDEPSVKEKGSSFVLRSIELGSGGVSYRCCGDILVYLKDKKNFNYGQELVVEGRVSRPAVFGGVSARGFRDYLYRKNIYLVIHPSATGVSSNSGCRHGFPVRRLALQVKAKIERLICAHMGELPAAVLDAMLLGEKRFIPRRVYDSMVSTGTVHILVVSGFNVGIVAFIISYLLKLMHLRAAARILVSALLLIFYCLMSGASNPVLRATIMAEALLFSRLIKREAGIFNPLGLSALLILLFSPKQLFDPGFQLSFASVFSIASLYPRLKTLFGIESIKMKPGKYLLEALLVSFSAWIGTAVLVLYYFRIFSAVAIIANLFIVPLAGLITLCGLSFILAELILPSLAAYFASSSELLILLLLKINSLISNLPFAYIRFS